MAIQRDWRILLGGVTFGFLLLAAATGLLRQQAKELAVYLRRVAERVNLYKRLASVLQIHSQFDASAATDGDTEMKDLVVSHLLEQSDSESEEEDTDDKPPAANDVGTCKGN